MPSSKYTAAQRGASQPITQPLMVLSMRVACQAAKRMVKGVEAVQAARHHENWRKQCQLQTQY
jgi:hypothetical protein